MILKTKRLILRGWKDEDASGLFKYASDLRVGPAAGWLPHTNEAYSRAIIRTVLRGKESYAICVQGSEDEPIGSIELTLRGSALRPLEEGEAELGFWVGFPFWGRGIATEAASEMIRHGFEDLGLLRIYCAYFDGNERSKKVQEKCGFNYHHTNEKTRIIQLGETRREHVNVMEYDCWKMQGFHCQ